MYKQPFCVSESHIKSVFFYTTVFMKGLINFERFHNESSAQFK